MTTLIKLLRLQKELQLRRLTPEVGIYRRWIAQLIEEQRKAQ